MIANRGFSEDDAERRIELQAAKEREDEWIRLFPGKKIRFIDNSGDESQLQNAIKNIL